jgi:hypothetical protein
MWTIFVTLQARRVRPQVGCFVAVLPTILVNPSVFGTGIGVTRTFQREAAIPEEGLCSAA